LKKYLIVGAGGAIASAISRKLIEEKNEVVGVVREHHRGKSKELALLMAGQENVYILDDVADREAVLSLSLKLGGDPFDGIIYAVGHCPPGGVRGSNRISVV
jgi:nucleoside-diphosphate-sugar epimerase